MTDLLRNVEVGNGAPSPSLPRPICGARTRAGEPCRRTELYRHGRCRFHGGLSTGPRTMAGKARVAANLPTKAHGALVLSPADPVLAELRERLRQHRERFGSSPLHRDHH